MLSGSVLGPLLFLIYINDLTVYEQFLKRHKQKDYRDLKSIAEWLKTNKISLDPGKTELVLFTSDDKKITKNINFRISGQKINMISETKYLGLILDEHFKFNET